MPSTSQAGHRTVTRYSIDALLIDCSGEVPADVLHAIDTGVPQVSESHCGEAQILVRFDPNRVDAEQLARKLATLTPLDATSTNDLMTLPVRYDGPDLEAVADACNMSTASVIARHSDATYRVAFDGFSPGFAYLTGLPKELELPRLDTPRPRIPAGSLAIAAHYCAIYPSASPGGWHLLGTCNAELFNPHRNPPALLRPGMFVRFEGAR